ncbi:kinase-like domain-containing protein [Trametes punicea]|nr:kinase-like domain-containing protein [Trametes punicea]
MLSFFSYIFGGLLRRIRGAVIQYLLRRARKFGGPRRINVSRLTSGLVLKRDSADRMSIEAEATAFVAARTSIPVPRVRWYWEENGRGNLVMDYVEGEQLQRVWRKLSDAQRLSVMRKIARFVDELRAIPQPPPNEGTGLPRMGWIGGPSGQAFFDFSMTSEESSFGPFANERDFYDWRVSRFKPFGDIHPPTAARIAEIRRAMPDNHPIVFTHGDINRRNVLVRVDGDGPDDVEITALLDWEQAGWRPIYWESRKWLFEDSGTPEWGEFGADQIGSRFRAEIELDAELQRISGHIPY